MRRGVNASRRSWLGAGRDGLLRFSTYPKQKQRLRGLLQNSVETARRVRARLQSCRKWPV
jgi:hypothetical protein